MKMLTLHIVLAITGYALLGALVLRYRIWRPMTYMVVMQFKDHRYSSAKHYGLDVNPTLVVLGWPVYLAIGIMALVAVLVEVCWDELTNIRLYHPRKSR